MIRPDLLRTRREFLANSGFLAATACAPGFLADTAAAVGAASGWEGESGAPLPGFKDDRVLVVIQLSGGNDGLNTVVPFSDDAYGRARGELALKPGEIVRVNDDTAFHSALAPLKGLYDRGVVSVVEGVGYPNPDRSHFRSMEIWHTACDSDANPRDGWIGRYFDNCCAGAPAPGPEVGVYLGNELPQAFQGARGLGVAFSSPEDYGYVAGKHGDDSRAFRAMNRRSHEGGEGSGATLDFLRHVVEDAMLSSDRVQRIANAVKNEVQYPREPFAQSLATIARGVRGGLGTRIYYTALGGFDTHSNQTGQHAALLARYAQGVAAFRNDLERMGQSGRVLVMTFSEFGRRLAANASRGTDHGVAGPMFLIGDAVEAGLRGARPSLSELDQGDLIHTTDFRSVYAAVLEDWFAADSESVLGRAFPKSDVLKTA